MEELLLKDDLLELAGKHNPISELKEFVEAEDWKITARSFDDLVGNRWMFYHSIDLNGQAALGMGSSKKSAVGRASRLMLRAIDDMKNVYQEPNFQKNHLG